MSLVDQINDLATAVATEIKSLRSTSLGTLYCDDVSLNNTALTGLQSWWQDGDIVLLVSQSDGTEQGPWVVHSSAWTRPPEFATGTSGQVDVFVINNSNSAVTGTQWAVSTTLDAGNLIGSVAVSVNPLMQSWSAGDYGLQFFPTWVTDSTGLNYVQSGWTGVPTLDSDNIVDNKFSHVMRVQWVTTENITDLSGLTLYGTADTMHEGDLLLLVNQESANNNRIWVVSSSAWTSYGYDTGKNGIIFLVANGPYGGSYWVALGNYNIQPLVQGVTSADGKSMTITPSLVMGTDPTADLYDQTATVPLLDDNGQIGTGYTPTKFLPPYAPTDAANPWDPSRSIYNIKATNMHTRRAKLAKLAQNTASYHLGWLSDSTGIGYNGSAYTNKSSIPYRTAQALGRLLGIPYVTSGLTWASAANTVAGDRWVFTGTWSFTSGSAVNSTASATATWTSPEQCTNIDFFVTNNSASGMTYTVDGGTATAISVDGTNTTKKVSVTGLTYGFHTIVITCPALCVVYGARCWINGVNQLHIHNLSYGGATANGPTSTINWSSQSTTGGAGLGVSYSGLMTASGVVFDGVCIAIGSNDLEQSVATATIKAGIETMLGYNPNAHQALIHELPIAGGDETAAKALAAEFFNLADEHDIPMFDWWDYLNNPDGSYAADGLAGADTIHPIYAAQNESAVWIAQALAERPYFGERNWTGIVGLPGGRYRVIETSGVYPYRPSVPAGGVDYVGTTEPTDWLDGDTWDQTS